MPGWQLKTCCVDLDDTAALQQLGRFDNVVMSYFRPTPALLVALSALLTPGGRIWLATFNQRQHHQQGFSARFCLDEGEFCDFSGQRQAGLSVLEYRSHNDDEGGIDSYLFEKDSE